MWMCSNSVKIYGVTLIYMGTQGMNLSINTKKKKRLGVWEECLSLGYNYQKWLWIYNEINLFTHPPKKG